MKNASEQQVLTANSLIDGDVIYLGKDGTWTWDILNSLIFTDQANAASALETALGHPDKIVAPYLIPVSINDGLIETLHFREKFRAFGPTNYRHGKSEIRGSV